MTIHTATPGPEYAPPLAPVTAAAAGGFGYAGGGGVGVGVGDGTQAEISQRGLRYLAAAAGKRA